MAKLLTRDERRMANLMKKAALAKKDRWTFLTEFVYTHDEHETEERATKRFPKKTYYRLIVRLYDESGIVYIVKSRQIMMSWLFTSLMLHESLFTEHRRMAIKCREDDSATKLLARMQFTYGKLIEGGFPALPLPKMNKERIGTDKDLKIPAMHSVVRAVPKGENVFRSETFSVSFLDEAPHQDDAQEAIGAATPNSKRLIAVGTPSSQSSYVYKIINGVDLKTGKITGKKIVDSYDVRKPRYTEEQLLEMSHDQFYALPLEEIVACIPDMHYWVMRNGDHVVPCLEVLYNADPDKRAGTPEGDAWYQRERPKYTPSDWEREQRGNWETFTGRPVISNWSSETFVSNEAKYNPKQILEISVDFGTGVCGALFGQKHFVPDFNFTQAQLIDEIVLRGSNTIALAQGIVALLRDKYEESWNDGNFVVYPDVSGGYGTHSTVSDRSANTDIKILKNHGLKIKGKKFGVPETTRLAEAVFANTSPRRHPGCIIHPRCEYFIKCLAGGWRFPDNIVPGQEGKPDKDGQYDHGGDMIRMLFANMFKIDELVPGANRHEIPKARIVNVHHPITGVRMNYRPQTKRRLIRLTG